MISIVFFNILNNFLHYNIIIILLIYFYKNNNKKMLIMNKIREGKSIFFYLKIVFFFCKFYAKVMQI